MTGVLSGLKVLDFSWVVAGPVIGRALADFGATVVRVESSKRVETARMMQPFYGGVAGAENSGLYGNSNAGKLGLTLDMSQDDGRAVARDLARWADVVIESFSPGLMQRWGLDYETLSADNPGLIMLSTSIMGQTGAYANLAGYGNIGASLSGFQNLVGWADEPPVGPFGPYTDYVGPRFSLAALLAALIRRERTGQGAYIDVSQVEAGIFFLSAEMADYFSTGTEAERSGNADREYAPHGVYPCLSEEGKDRFVAIAATSDEQWSLLAGAMGQAELAARHPSTADRMANAREIDDAIAQWTGSRRAAEVEQVLQHAGVAAHVASSPADWGQDPQLAFRGHLVRLPHPLHGEVVVEGPRYALSETPAVVERAAPTFGQDNTYILTELLGYGQDRIGELNEAGVLK